RSVSFPCSPPSEPYPPSLHDALPIFATGREHIEAGDGDGTGGKLDVLTRANASICALPCHLDRADCAGPLLDVAGQLGHSVGDLDRKSTRLNSSHVKISYAVFCLKKK